MSTTLKTTILFRRGDFAATYNKLKTGEPAFHTTDKVFKIGQDGVAWSELPAYLTLPELTTALANYYDKTAIDGFINSINGNITTLTTDVGTLKTDVQGLKDYLELDENLDLKTRVTDIEEDVADLTATVNTLNAATHFAGTGTYAEMIALAADKKTAGAIYVVVGSEGDDAQYNGHEFVYDGTNWIQLGDTTAEQERISTLEGDVDTLEGDVDALETNLSNNYYNKNAVEGLIDTAKSDVIGSDQDSAEDLTITGTRQYIDSAIAEVSAKAGISAVAAGTDIVVTPDASDASKVTIAHKAYNSGDLTRDPAALDTGDAYVFTALTLSNGHVESGAMQSVAGILAGLEFILDGGNAS